MPIIVDSEICDFSRDEFHSMAEKVIGIAFDIHNQLGRLMNEDIYKQVLRNRCETFGITPARREVKITVTHRDFEKTYFMDLLLANRMMVEAKTVEQLTKTHYSQALQKIPIFDGDREIGLQEQCLISEDTTFALTSVKTGQGTMNDHLHRFLCHTKLSCIQWINMNKHDIEFRTLTR